MRRKREIVCFETGERFASVTDAASAIGAARPLVSSALKRHGACRGFHFYYADEAEPDDSVFDRKVYKNSRPIICLETNERFESQARAAKAVGVPREAIYAALRGHIATKGLHFYYADEPKPDEEFFRNRSWTRVRCKETGVVYESIAQAARETGVSERNIQAAAKRHGTAKGLHFYYADEPEPDDLLPSKRGIRVRCVETVGTRYSFRHGRSVRESRFMKARGAMTMDDCGSEKTICYEEDGWSVTLTRYVSMELGETVASWVEFPNGWYLHSDDADAEFTQDGAETYLQRLKSVWMESPFWDGVRRAMEEKPQ